MIPGVYQNSIEDYHSGPGLSRSSLMNFRDKTPFHYWYKINNPEPREEVPIIKKSNALDFGNALHTFILEPLEFAKRYMVFEKVNRATKAGKDAYAEAQANANGRQFLCAEAYEELCGMDYAITQHAEARGIIDDALYEQSIYWNDPGTKMLCKVRPDIWHSNLIGDLKTCQSASYEDFQKSIVNHGYHIQAAMIHEGLKHALGIDMRIFLYVAIEKEPPYAVAVYQLDDVALVHGVSQFRKTLREIQQCEENDFWPSYPSAVISLPKWAYII